MSARRTTTGGGPCWAWAPPRWVATPLVALPVAAAASATGHTYVGVVAACGALAGTLVALLVGVPRVRRFVPVVAPTLIGATVALYGSSDRGALRSAAGGDPGYHHRVAALLAIAAVAAVLLAAGVDVARLLARGVGAASRALTAAAGTVAFVVLLLPAWAWTRARGRDPLRGGPRRRSRRAGAPVTWGMRSGAPTPSSLGTPVPSTDASRNIVGRLTWSVGCVVLLAGGNYGVGWAWDRATGHSGPESVAAPGGTGSRPRDPRNDVPAMAAYPWRADYFDAIQRAGATYWPFTESRSTPFHSRYVNIDGWTRRSYRTPGAAADRPTVWMFGGSTTWGEGQRDRYTIASWLARLAERDRVPIAMRNYGQRGWTHFQEMVLYEQRLAAGPVPDLSVFYDGANEITTQSLLDEAVPAHTLTYSYAKKLTGSTIATQFVQNPAATDPWADAYTAYSEHSLLHKLVRLVRPTAAGASPAQAAGDAPGVGITPNQKESHGGVYDYHVTPQDGTDAGKVYERGKQFTMLLSARYHVDSLLLWQPVRHKGKPELNAIDELTPPTIDISDALADHDDLFIDGGHTNEEGARIVAVEIWKHLGPKVRAWYRAHP